MRSLVFLFTMFANYIPNQPEESGIWQGGSADFLSRTSDSVHRHSASAEQKMWGKADAAKNQFFRLFEYNTYLTVKEVHNEGFVLMLNDGSEWDIKYFGGGWRLLGWGWTEQQEVSHWAIGDTIEIQYPGSGNLIDFILLIKNLSKKEEAWATLKQAPSVDYAVCLWVVDFDEEANHITLSDGTAWFTTTTDMYGALFQQKPHSLSKWKSVIPLR